MRSEITEQLSLRDDRIEAKLDRLIDSQGDMKADIAKLNLLPNAIAGLGTRVNKIQKWQLLVSGGAIAIGILLAKAIELLAGR
jgi:hypothetical protein